MQLFKPLQLFQELNVGTPASRLRLNTGIRKQDGYPRFQDQFHVRAILVSRSFVPWLYLTHFGPVVYGDAARINCQSTGQCLRCFVMLVGLKGKMTHS